MSEETRPLNTIGGEDISHKASHSEEQIEQPHLRSNLSDIQLDFDKLGGCCSPSSRITGRRRS